MVSTFVSDLGIGVLLCKGHGAGRGGGRFVQKCDAIN